MSSIPTDPRERELYDLAVRIGLAWREMRRGGSSAGVRDWLYGTGENAVEQGQMDTLDVLVLQPSWRMSALAEELRVDPSTATRAVQRLEKQGFAERRPSKDDGRVVEVRATAAGRRRQQIVNERRAVLLTELLSRFRVKELPVLAELFERFNGAVEQFLVAHETNGDA